MNIVRELGGSTIRSQTLGVSVGNPLSLWPTLTTRNPQAFDTIDWAVYEAGQHGLRIQMPLVDNYDYYHVC
jgi:mannan endo-1,4-beta-mannosidase